MTTLSTKVTIGMLVAGHIVAGLILVWAQVDKEWPSPSEVGLASLLFADAGLLGIWGALGTTRLRWRLSVVLVGTVYLIAAVIASESDPAEIGLEGMIWITSMIGLPTLVILVVLSALRHSRRHLHVARAWSASAASEGLKFTIRHLLLTTAIAAVVLAVGRSMPQVEQTAAVFVVLCPCLVMVELAVFWGAMGLGPPASRLLIVLPTAFVVGLVPPFYLKSMPQEWSTFVAWSCIHGLQATITAASLLVVRACGYRLVGRGTGGAIPLPVEVVGA